MDQIQDLENEIQDLKDQIENLEQRLDDTILDRDYYKDQAETLEEDLEALDKELRDSHEEYRELDELAEQHRHTIEDLYVKFQQECDEILSTNDLDKVNPRVLDFLKHFINVFTSYETYLTEIFSSDQVDQFKIQRKFLIQPEKIENQAASYLTSNNQIQRETFQRYYKAFSQTKATK